MLQIEGQRWRARDYARLQERLSELQGHTPAPMKDLASIVSHEPVASEHAASADVPIMDLAGEECCRQCSQSMRLVPSKAILVCTTCGSSTPYIDATTLSMAYGDEVEITSLYCYKRLNHFRLQLQQLQAIETVQISDATMQLILQSIYESGVRRPEDVSVRMIRLVLKKLKLRKCYDHIPQIHSRITGQPPVRLTPELLEQCRVMFINIQPAFEKHCPQDRKNFISYRFLLYKMFQLLGYDELLPYMTLLKGKDKLMRQDSIFRLICKELNWQFIPSM